MDDYQKAQQRAAKFGAAATGAAGLLNQWTGMENSPTLPTQAPSQTRDLYGRPEFNLGQQAKEVNEFVVPKTGVGEVASGALTGASAGAAFGPLGAGIGAGVGALGTLVFGRRRRKKAEKAKRLAQGNLFAAQQLYNKSVGGYNQDEAAYGQYNNLMNTQNRIQNLYTYNNQ